MRIFGLLILWIVLAAVARNLTIEYSGLWSGAAVFAVLCLLPPYTL